MPAEQATQRFRVGEVPPLAEGYTDRPDTARGIVEMLVPGKTLALVPGSAFAEGPSNWLGACGKTQIAVIIAESLWRSGAIDVLIWIPATSRESVLSGLCSRRLRWPSASRLPERPNRSRRALSAG